MLIDRTCEQCRQSFQVRAYRIQQGRGRYCSIPCRTAAQVTRVQRQCEICTTPFETHPSKIAKGHGRYCSPKCMGAAMRTTSEAFWRRVVRGKPSACWPWLGATGKAGHGRTLWQDRHHSAHRVAYELTYGPVPDGLQVCHRCDNAPCCNPQHLYLDTPAGNNADMWARGRGRSGPQIDPSCLPRGERHPNAKLTTAAVLRIRVQAAAGVRHRDLADTYGVSNGAIGAVVSRRLWRHV